MVLFMRKKNTPERQSGSFTLIELLVVVAIIAVLVAVLLPALQGARDRAKTVACQGNLKQFAVSLRMYADDFNGYLPCPPPGDPTNWWFLSMVNSKHLVLEGQGRPSILYCPAETKYGSYWGVNYAINNIMIGLKLDELMSSRSYGNPVEKVIIFIDSRPDWTMLNLWGGAYPYGEDWLRDARGYRHSGSDNVLFGDLHIQWMDNLHYYPPHRSDYAWY
jgi:prepilin-type N-terminal cleavage/methylation domain-containing protein